jgi:hypothetical protein
MSKEIKPAGIKSTFPIFSHETKFLQTRKLIVSAAKPTRQKKVPTFYSNRQE